MPSSRLLFIDESLSKRLCTMLRQRGRASDCCSRAKLIGLEDGPLLRQVYKARDDIVFVTADDSLPFEHGDVLGEVGATIATIAPFERGRWRTHDPDIADEEAWKREIVHRWAHAMQEQERRTFKRYFLSGARPWTERKRRYL